MTQHQSQEARIDAELERRIEKLTEGQAVAITKIAPAFVFGCNWGFMLSGEEDFKAKASMLAKESSIKGYKASNGYIVTADVGYITNVVHLVLPNFVNSEYVAKVQERKKKELDALGRYVKRAVTDFEGKQVRVEGQVIHTSIAIYSVNETGYIRTRGAEFNAFKLNIAEALITAQKEAALKQKTLYVTVREPDASKRMYAFEALVNQLGEGAYARILAAAYIVEAETGVVLNIGFR